MAFTRNELTILWYLKRCGPAEASGSLAPGHPGLVNRIAEATGLHINTVRGLLRKLEQDCVILRTYKRPEKQKIGDGKGLNPLVRVELVDPKMYLPPAPPPLPLGVVIAHENVEMQTMIDQRNGTHEPNSDKVIEALLSVIDVDREQITKLQDIVNAQANEILELKKQQRRTPSEHLTTRVRDVVPPETWERLLREK